MEVLKLANIVTSHTMDGLVWSAHRPLGQLDNMHRIKNKATSNLKMKGSSKTMSRKPG